MENKKELRDELENSPFLKKMKEQPEAGFRVPKHYFKHLPDEVTQRVKQPAPNPAPSRPSWLEQLEQLVLGLFQPRYAFAFASVLALVVAGIGFFGKNSVETVPPTAEVNLADISDDELFAYVSENIGDFNRQMMLEATGPELPEVKTQSKTPTLPKTNVPKPNVEEMEKYLDEVIDEIDLEDLENML